MEQELVKNTVLGLIIPADFFHEFARVIREDVCHPFNNTRQAF
jgi:hypothetical protein